LKEKVAKLQYEESKESIQSEVTPKALIEAYKNSQSQQYIQGMLHTKDSSKQSQRLSIKLNEPTQETQRGPDQNRNLD